MPPYPVPLARICSSRAVPNRLQGQFRSAASHPGAGPPPSRNLLRQPTFRVHLGVGVRGGRARRRGRAWLPVGLLCHVQFPSFLAGSGPRHDPCPSARPGEPGEGCGRGRPGCEPAGRGRDLRSRAALPPCRPRSVGRGAAPPRRPANERCWPAAVCGESDRDRASRGRDACGGSGRAIRPE